MHVSTPPANITSAAPIWKERDTVVYFFLVRIELKNNAIQFNLFIDPKCMLNNHF